jgi:hypothetical protein
VGGNLGFVEQKLGLRHGRLPFVLHADADSDRQVLIRIICLSFYAVNEPRSDHNEWVNSSTGGVKSDAGSGQSCKPMDNGLCQFIRMIEHEVMLALREHDQLLVCRKRGEILVLGTQGGIGFAP